jgi:vesicle coat complex subunit
MILRLINGYFLHSIEQLDFVTEKYIFLKVQTELLRYLDKNEYQEDILLRLPNIVIEKFYSLEKKHGSRERIAK